MFRWLKRKCRRQCLENKGKKLFNRSRIEEQKENEYHIYEEIVDLPSHEENAYAVVSLGSRFDIDDLETDTDCPVCKYGRLDQDVPCVCEDQKRRFSYDAHVLTPHHSSSVMTIDKHCGILDISKRPLPKLPTELPPPCKSEEDALSDTSSGYDSNSLSSVDIGIEDDILVRLDNMHKPKFAILGSISIFNSLPRNTKSRERPTNYIQDVVTNQSGEYAALWTCGSHLRSTWRFNSATERNHPRSSL